MLLFLMMRCRAAFFLNFCKLGFSSCKTISCMMKGMVFRHNQFQACLEETFISYREEIKISKLFSGGIFIDKPAFKAEL